MSTFINQPFVEFQMNGDMLYLRSRISPIFSRHNEREGTIFILQDVTQFKELDKMKSDFMATVSHEFRTPVTSMTMGVDILRQQLLGPLTKQQEDMLDSFKQDCGRLTKLVRDLLQLSKLESGSIRRSEELIDMRTLIISAANQVKLQFKEKGIEIAVTIPNSLPSITGDTQQISWVVLNLLNNAHQHTPSGGKVELSVSVAGDELLLSVKDSGNGIPKEYLGKIFDKFVQVKHPNDPTPGSVGLGLSIAKDIVEMYGGKIWVESEVKKGSTFTVQLPVQQGVTA
ncbi:MAG: HAMP domain-containing histidine kinase [Ignavibacteriales bacterium]|nr:HAMP domain-containing histidine kinase [Ignavibacteriales bacterium]